MDDTKRNDETSCYLVNHDLVQRTIDLFLCVVLYHSIDYPNYRYICTNQKTNEEMKKTAFLIVALITFSCAKHEDAKMWVETVNVKTLSFNGDEGTIYNLNAIDDTNFYFSAMTKEKIKFGSQPINPNFPFKFDVYQSVDGTDIQIIHIYSETSGEFKTW